MLKIMKYRIEMTELKPKPENPFDIGLINETTITRTAEMEAESVDKIKEYFKDAKEKGYASVKDFELTNITRIEGI